MKTSHSVKWIMAGALMMPGLTGCSFFGGGEETVTEEVAATEENAEASPEATATEAVAGAETDTINDAQVAADAEAAAGPAGGGLPDSEIPPELLANDAIPSAPDPMTGMPVMNATEPAPGSAPAPAAGGFSAPPSDVRVYYVNASSAILHDTPSADSQSVGALKKGDPVLVKVEGTWANVVNRGWVELASLSMGPVNRSKPAKAWN
jgi:hypothetical protein